MFADEIYSRLVYDGRFDTLATRAGMLERTIISDGASKTWAMTGWRIGYVANRALAPVFTRWITNTESCASQISQWAARRRDRPARRMPSREMRARFLERRDLIVRLLNDVPGVTCKRPAARSTRGRTSPRRAALTGCADSEAFRKRLLNEAGIAVLADIHFGRRVPGDGQHIRFSYAASNEAIEKGVARLDAFVRKHTVCRRMTRVVRSTTIGSREAVLARVRKALGRDGPDDDARAAAQAYIAAHAQGPRPAMPADLVAALPRARARHGEHRRAHRRARRRSARGRALSRRARRCRRAREQRSRAACAGRNSPTLDWSGAGLHDRIAADGRPRSRSASPAASARSPRPARSSCVTRHADAVGDVLLPDTHVAVVRADRIVAGMEDAFALVRGERGDMPRAINLISGPSRTGDIEQTIVLGAHGPRRCTSCSCCR